MFPRSVDPIRCVALDEGQPMIRVACITAVGIYLFPDFIPFSRFRVPLYPMGGGIKNRTGAGQGCRSRLILTFGLSQSRSQFNCFISKVFCDQIVHTRNQSRSKSYFPFFMVSPKA